MARTRAFGRCIGGDLPFRVKYPRLYSLSNQKEAKVGDLRVGSTLGGGWYFSWRRSLIVWENEMLSALMVELEGFTGRQTEDVWWWRLEDEGKFSVKSMYKKLEGVMLDDRSFPLDQGRVFSRIWRSAVPSKVAAFTWKLLLNRIPTKANLAHRQVLPPESPLVCVMCDDVVESAIHLFLHCPVAMKVWDDVMYWLGFMFLTPPNLFVMWDCWVGVFSNKKIRKGVRLIWHAVVWTLWKTRNDRIFNNLTRDVEEVVEKVKVLSWRWGLSRLQTSA